MVIRRSEHWVIWLLLVISLAGLAMASAFFLRQNNLNMVKLRDELAQADKSGKVEVVNQAARKLQRYVSCKTMPKLRRILCRDICLVSTPSSLIIPSSGS